MSIKPNDKYLSLRNPGSKGWNSFDEPASIDDLELVDVQNMVYDNGFLAPRPGANREYTKPSGESGDPLQLIKAETSDGVRYTIAVYANHFYIRNTDVDLWARINTKFVPVETTRRYGNVNWQNGRGDDRLYLCNGVDDFIRWDVCMSQLNGAIASSATSLIVDDGSRFPTPASYTASGVNTGTEEITIATHPFVTGDLVFLDAPSGAPGGLTHGGIYFAIKVSTTVVKLATSYANAIAGTAINLTSAGSGTIKIYSGISILVVADGSNTIQVGYTARSSNTFTLSGTAGTAMADNAIVTLEMRPKPAMELGKYVGKFQRRLIVANYYGGETVFWGSVQADPEDFTLASTIAGAFTQTLADGNGEITGVHDFGQFFVVEKQDSIHAVKLEIASDLGTKLVVVEPVISGQSVGPLGMQSTSKVMNRLFYPTSTNGFMSLSPTTSGDSTSVGVKSLSLKIDPYISSQIELAYSKVAATSNKIYWAVALTGATQNTLVLEYDILRDAWTKHFGWGASDLLEIGGEVQFLEIGTGDVWQLDNGAYNDAGQEYLASASFKRFDYGEIGKPKSQDVIYLQGYMTTASEFFVDVFFNENGVLGKQTYRINKDTTGISFTDSLTDEMGAFILGDPILGMASLSGIAGLRMFRCYLGINVSKGYYNIQPRVYGTRAAFWGITGMAMNPEILPITPFGFIVAPETST